MRHDGPSSVGTDTLERTLAAAGRDSKRLQELEAFFRGTGVHEHLIAHFRSRAGAGAGQRYYPAYIAPDRTDAGFARMLYEQLQAAGVRIWLDLKRPFDDRTSILGKTDWRGERLILCVSAAALESEWLPVEIAGAVSAMRRQRRDGLLVVDLDGCLRDGWNGKHAEWIRQWLVADLGELANGEGSLAEAIERVLGRLRTGG